VSALAAVGAFLSARLSALLLARRESSMRLSLKSVQKRELPSGGFELRECILSRVRASGDFYGETGDDG
jgi:hypothetical protein